MCHYVNVVVVSNFPLHFWSFPFVLCTHDLMVQMINKFFVLLLSINLTLNP
jgi:hypothetical protein